ncbi:MAG: hypothetical protein HNEKOMLI_00896 [Sodalis sp. Psp]|nr:hypothetical protein [Sodalis sp. Psp]MCR3757355.1 hypothetical protein [Sodalis sp. Ppy]
MQRLDTRKSCKYHHYAAAIEVHGIRRHAFPMHAVIIQHFYLVAVLILDQSIILSFI